MRATEFINKQQVVTEVVSSQYQTILYEYTTTQVIDKENIKVWKIERDPKFPPSEVIIKREMSKIRVHASVDNEYIKGKNAEHANDSVLLLRTWLKVVLEELPKFVKDDDTSIRIEAHGKRANIYEKVMPKILTALQQVNPGWVYNESWVNNTGATFFTFTNYNYNKSRDKWIDKKTPQGVAEGISNAVIFFRGEPILSQERLNQLKSSIGKPYPILRKEGSAKNIGTYMTNEKIAKGYITVALAGQGKGGAVTKIAVDLKSFQSGDGGIDEAVIITNIAGLVSDQTPNKNDPLRIQDRKKAMLKYLGPGVKKYLNDPLLSDPKIVQSWYNPEFAQQIWNTIKSGKRAETKPGENNILERMKRILGPLAEKIRRDPEVISYFIAAHKPNDWVEYNFRMNSDGSGTKVLDVKYYPPAKQGVAEAIAWSELDEGLSLKEVVHPDIFDKHISKKPTEKVRMGDFEFDAHPFKGKIRGYGNLNDIGLYVTAYDRQNVIGWAHFVVKSDEKGNQWLESADTQVDDDYVGRGVAAMMYAFAKSLGNDIKPSPHQTNFGKRMWKKWGKDANHLVGEQGVAEGSLNETSSDEAWELVGQPVPEIQQFVKQMGYGDDEQSVSKIASIIDSAPTTQIPVSTIPKLKNLANKGNDVQTLKAVQQISGRQDAEQQYTKLMQARDAQEGRTRDVSGYIKYVKSGNYDPPVLLKLPSGVYVVGGRTRLYAALALGVPANVKIISVNNFKQGVAEDTDHGNNQPLRLRVNTGRVQKFIEAVYARYPQTFQNNHVMSWGEGEAQQLALFELVPSMSKRDAVDVKWFQAYPLRQGVGSRAMRVLQDMAREDGISLTLYPWDKGQISQTKLIKFYKSHGFKPTMKGSKNMVWEPVNEQGVAEAFDNPYKGNWETSEYGDQDMNVKLPDGTWLSIMFNHEGNNEWQVEFHRGNSGNSQAITGQGDQQRIFATVIAAIQKFIREENPWRIIFSASKVVEPGQNSESRARLYNRLVARYARDWGYEEYNEDHGDQVTYELTRISKKGVAEGKLNEFATDSGGGGDDILKTLAAQWLNGDVSSGDLDSDIQSQEKVERRLEKGVTCPDGVKRKLYIDYSDDYEGVVIYGDDNWSITYKQDDLSESHQGVAEGRSKDFAERHYAAREIEKIIENLLSSESLNVTPEIFKKIKELVAITGRSQDIRYFGSAGELIDKLTDVYRQSQIRSGQMPQFTGRAAAARDMARQIANQTRGTYRYFKPQTWTTRFGQRYRDPADYVVYPDQQSYDDALEWIENKGKKVRYRDNFGGLTDAIQIGSYIIEPSTFTQDAFSDTPQITHRISVRLAKTINQGGRQQVDITDQQAAALQDIASTKSQNAIQSIQLILKVLQGEQNIKQIIDNSKKITPQDKAKLDAIITGAKNFQEPNQGVSEAWSEKYKRSINCDNPKGFSQRAHCQGRKKNNEQIELDERKKKRKTTKKTNRYFYGPVYYGGYYGTGDSSGDGGGGGE